MTEALVQEITKRVVKALEAENNRTIPVGVSSRHVHLSAKDLALLFGDGYQLKALRPLSQPGQFAAMETVDLITEKGTIAKVRILGPIRGESQVELALTDSFKLGLKPPLRNSGEIQNTPGITLKGPKGTVILEKGVIVAKRHIHMSVQDAAQFGVKDHDMVQVRIDDERGGILNHVLVRVNENFALDFHVDTDEGNAMGLKTGDHVCLV